MKPIPFVAVLTGFPGFLIDSAAAAKMNGRIGGFFANVATKIPALASTFLQYRSRKQAIANVNVICGTSS